MDNESVNSEYTESVTSSAFYNIFDNLNDTEFSDIIETIEELFLIYVDDNSINMKDYKFVDTCTNTISNELYITWMDTNICTENNYDEIYHLVNSQINTLLIKYNIVSYVSEYNNDNLNNTSEIREILKNINKIPQPQQRTTEWYKIRNNLISASSMWKIFKSDTTKRNLII